MTMTEVTTLSVSDCLGVRGIAIKATAMNKALHSAGVLQKAWRPSSKDSSKTKSYWTINPEFSAYAVELQSELSPVPVVQFVAAAFDALLDFLAPTIAAMQREGELGSFDRCPIRADAYRIEWEQKRAEREQAETGEQF
jgi:hypothetical protein